MRQESCDFCRVINRTEEPFVHHRDHDLCPECFLFFRLRVRAFHKEQLQEREAYEKLLFGAMKEAGGAPSKDIP